MTNPDQELSPFEGSDLTYKKNSLNSQHHLIAEFKERIKLLKQKTLKLEKEKELLKKQHDKMKFDMMDLRNQVSQLQNENIRTFYFNLISEPSLQSSRL